LLTDTPVISVRDAIPVGILPLSLRAAASLGRAWILGIEVVGVGNAITVCIGTASVLRQTPHLRAVIIDIADPVAIAVFPTPGHRTAISPNQPRFTGAVIIPVTHPIAIPVRAAFGQRRARFVGTHVFVIKSAVAVPVGGVKGGAPVP
jgi:hypothetical protein